MLANRENQRKRTRRDLLEAALEISGSSRTPSLEEVAEAAGVSRATAYRYFPNIDALLAEASLHLAFPDADDVYASAANDPVDRLCHAQQAVDHMIAEHEVALRTMVAGAARHAASHSDLPARQNRRLPLIAAALEPFASEFDPTSLDKLQKALALVIGTEAMLVFKDVLRLTDDEAHAVKAWIIRALVSAARKPG